jgi:hypothetical protein
MKSLFSILSVIVFFNLGFSQSKLARKKDATALIKVSPFSPFSGHTMLSYEKFTKPNRSMEISLSIIGAGINQNIDYVNLPFPEIYNEGKSQKGVALGYGYRFYIPWKQFNVVDFKNIPLTGFYFKPTIYASYFSDDPFIREDLTFDGDKVISVALLLENGWQLVIKKYVSIDLYFGFGYSLVNIDFSSLGNYFYSNGVNYDNNIYSRINVNQNQYTHTRYGKNPGLALSAGFKLGIVTSRKNTFK